MIGTGRAKLFSPAWLIAFALAATLLRLWLAAELGLAPDEAYYWRWSENLSLGYADHPPLVAWLIRAGTETIGDNELGVRLFTVIISFVGVFVAFYLAEASGLSRAHAGIAALVASLLPAPAAGSIITTPDTAAAFCWMLALLALVRMAGSAGPRAWLLVGASLGAGIVAKQSALLIVPMAAISYALSAQLRQKTKPSHILSACALSLAIAAPYLVFEFRSGFPSISFQISHLTGRLDVSSQSVAARLAALAAGQIGLLTPLVAAWLVYLLAAKRKDRLQAIVAAGYLIPLAAATLAAFFTHPEQNWASLGHPAAAICAIGAIAQRYGSNDPSNAKKRRIWIAATAGTAALATLVVHVHAARPFLPLPSEQDPISRLHGWDRLDELASNADRFDAIVCGDYGVESELAWHTRNRDRTNVIASLDRPPLPPSGSWLILANGRDDGLAAFFESCAVVQTKSVHQLKRNDGKSARTLTLAIGSRCDANRRKLLGLGLGKRIIEQR